LEKKKLTRRREGGGLVDFGASRGSARLDEFVSMTIVGLVVEVNSEDFNVASELSSVDRQENGHGASFQISVENLVSGSGGDTSRLHVDSAGQNWWRSPVTVNDFSESCGVDARCAH